MIVKQAPEDFQVEELTTLQPAGDGEFAFYCLEKRGWTTHDALDIVRRRWRLEQRRLSHGGLKDRHARTLQYFTVYRGPRRQLHQQGVTVTYLGQLTHAFISEHIAGNRFQITLRNLTREDREYAVTSLDDVQHSGVPNYFDDQRFGSVDGGGEFFARALLLGDNEKALRLALAAPYTHDRAPQKKEKSLMRSLWGDWSTLQKRLPHGANRSIVDFLAHNPGDFPGAIMRLRPELRSLYLSAYQSHLWNRMLASWLAATQPKDNLLSVPLRLGPVPFFKSLDADQSASLADVSLPLPSPKATLEETDPRKKYLDDVLAEEKLTLEQFKLSYFKEMFFSRGERKVICPIAELESVADSDEANSGKDKLSLTFTLPRGCYATLVVKRLTRGS